MKKVKIYAGFERFWHLAQALLIIALGVTGFEIYGSLKYFGFEKSYSLHQTLAWALLVLIILAIFWHFVSGEWKQYLPTRGLRKMIRFYVFGIFNKEPHPIKKTLLSKLNPLQRITYLGFKLFIIPVQVTTGLLYMYYNNWADWGLDFLNLQCVATIHILGSFALLVFFIIHVYMTTTGHTVFANIKAMATGYEELED